MKYIQSALIIGFSVLVGPNWALGSSLVTSYLKLNLPPSWSCKKSYSDWICRSQIPQDKKRNLMIVNSKVGSAEETLVYFNNIYGRPISRKVAKGQGAGAAPKLSQLISLKTRDIDGVQWIDAVHFESEIPNYYTRYLVARHSALLILLTISSHESQWAKQVASFDKMTSSILLMRPEAAGASAQIGSKWSKLITKRNISFALIGLAVIFGLAYLLLPNAKSSKKNRKGRK